MKPLLSSAAAGLVLALGVLGATAQSIPVRPFALIVPWPAGGVHAHPSAGIRPGEPRQALPWLDRVYWYKSSDDYAKWGAETLKAERAAIEPVGLLLKQ